MNDKERKPLTVAEQAVSQQMRRWPTLYPDAISFYDACVVGPQGDFKWENGILVGNDNNKYLGEKDGVARWGTYPFRLSKDVAQDLMHSVLHIMRHPCLEPRSPIENLPDDLHKDWQDFIDTRLFLDHRITPELFDVILEAYVISLYGRREKPSDTSSTSHYRNEWKEYWKRIPFLQARLRAISQLQRTGKVDTRTEAEIAECLEKDRLARKIRSGSLTDLPIDILKSIEHTLDNLPESAKVQP